MNSEQSKPNILADYNIEETTGISPDVATDEVDQNTTNQDSQNLDTAPTPGENVVDRQIDIIARM